MMWLDRLGCTLPIVQAPMAGVSTPAMAVAVSGAGALGSIGIGAADVAGAAAMIAGVRAGTARAFNVNVFVHPAPGVDPAREAAWIERLRAAFERFGAVPPEGLRTIYTSFADDDAMQAMLVEAAPPVVSFHFGLPRAEVIAALRARGVVTLATATNVAEARAIAAAGIDGIVAQGIEAGGHRGLFDADADDPALGTMALVPLLVRATALPVIAAGGIMNGAGIAAALDLGAVAAQLGTAFVGCDESAADAGYRAALFGEAAYRTVMTRAISGRPARALANLFTALGEGWEAEVPDYPRAYDVGKALHAAALACGESGFGAQWAGQGAPLARAMPARALVETLAREWRAASRGA
ncbi:MAG: nitronate monooxygenase [Sphingomonas adhaesiva]